MRQEFVARQREQQNPPSRAVEREEHLNRNWMFILKLYQSGSARLSAPRSTRVVNTYLVAARYIPYLTVKLCWVDQVHPPVAVQYSTAHRTQQQQ